MTNLFKISMSKLKEAWERAKHKREWSQNKMLACAVPSMKNDAQWMHHDPVVRALAERWIPMIEEGWERHEREDIDYFRSKLGLCPHHPAPQIVKFNDGEPKWENGTYYIMLGLAKRVVEKKWSMVHNDIGRFTATVHSNTEGVLTFIDHPNLQGGWYAGIYRIEGWVKLPEATPRIKN